MELLVDIGNSALKYLGAAQLWAGEAPRHHPYRDGGLDAVLDAHWASLPAPARVHVACVASEAGEELAQWCRRHWDLQPHFLATGVREAGVENGYTEPVQLGVDRWAALVGAHALGPDDYCLVDAGTAVTVDYLDGRGRHRGGLILPGFHLMQAAVAQGTDLPRIAASDALPAFPGRDTAGCIAAGSQAAVVGAVREALARAPAVLGMAGGTPRCLLCGGDARRLLPQLAEAPGVAVEYHPELVLRGVARLAGLAVV